MLKGKQYYESKDDCGIIPRNFQYMGIPYKITSIHRNYHINKYYIVVNNKQDNKIEEIILSKCFHPNVYHGESGRIKIDNPPLYSKFCLPIKVIGSKLISTEDFSKLYDLSTPRPKFPVISEQYIQMSLLYLWDMNNPHHVPSRKYIKTNPEYPFY